MSDPVAAVRSADGPVLLQEDMRAGDGAVRILLLNRPAKRNALNTALFVSLLEALADAQRDPLVRAVVIAGSGPSFCGGGDLGEFRADADPLSGVVARSRLLGELLTTLPKLSIPVVGAVRGAAVGAGAVLAIAADLTIASSDMTLSFPELQDGVVPGAVTSPAVKAFGPKLAFELLTTSRRLTAGEALQYGVVNRVVEPQRLLEEAIGVARVWAEVSPEAMQETKQLFRRTLELSLDEGVAAGIDTVARTWAPVSSRPGRREFADRPTQRST